MTAIPVSYIILDMSRSNNESTTTLRVSRRLHAVVKLAAKKDGRTVEKFVERMITAVLFPRRPRTP